MEKRGSQHTKKVMNAELTFGGGKFIAYQKKEKGGQREEKKGIQKTLPHTDGEGGRGDKHEQRGSHVGTDYFSKGKT